MKIVVCVKQVIDLAQLRFKSDRRTPVSEGLPVMMGSFEKNALESAIQLKEAREDVHVIALSAGKGKLKDTVKEALAIGADEAILVTDPLLAGSDVAASARVLSAAIQKIGEVDLILLGEGSDDEYTGQIPSRLAGLLNLPQITMARALEVVDEHHIRATRDLENMLETIECSLPSVVSVTSELNTPRLPPLTAILKAGRKPVQEWSLADLGLSPEQVDHQAALIEVLENLAPAQERKNIVFEGPLEEQVASLLRELEHEGVLP